jgi:hypothetical protein
MGEQRQPIQALEYPAIGAVFLLASVGLTTREEPALPFQEEELSVRARPDRHARCIGVRR